MAPIKRRAQTRNNHKKVRRRKPNISELVYKYLSLDNNREGGENVPESYKRKCRFCKGQKRPVEVLDSLDSHSSKNMANKRKDSRNSKLHRVKRRPTARDQTLSSCMHKSSGKEGIKKMKRYIQKALEFGVESGYLIPKDTAYKVLHVSSDLMNDSNYEARKSGSPVSQVRGKTVRRTPIRFEDYEVQDARRRRRRRGARRRRRSRSGSRRRRRSRRRRSRRGRRRSRSENADEVVEVERDEYEYNNQPEKRNTTESANRGEESSRANQSDGEKATEDKREDDDGSDLSVDEDETDDDEEKKRGDTTKS